MNLTPKEIIQTCRNTPPFQVKGLVKNYIGQKISWELEYFSVHEFPDKLNVSFYQDLILVTCEIKEADFPMIKLIHRGTPIRLSGEIQDVDSGQIKIQNPSLQIIKDENGELYFPKGSREDQLSFLRSKMVGVENIKIYDAYPSKEILELVENAPLSSNIKLLGEKIEENFIEEAKAFKTYFHKIISVRKTNVSHARFYILDDNVFQVDSSFRRGGGDKATMIHKIEGTELIEKEFDKWWAEAEPVF